MPPREYEDALRRGLVQVLPSKFAQAFPSHEHNLDGRGRHVPLVEALTQGHAFDAYMIPYLSRDRQGRLSKRAPDRLPSGVHMTALVLNVLDPGRHTGDGDGNDAWRHATQTKLDNVLRAHPGGYVYWSGSGCRLVYRLEPVLLRTWRDGADWARRYVARCDYFERAFDLPGDRGCKDWTHLFGLNDAARGVAGTSSQTIGDATRIGFFTGGP